MGLWTDYTKKDTPEDNDTLMLYDAAGKENKQTLFSGFWKWVVKKLKEATLSDLETTNKTMIGALNELNSKVFTNTQNLSTFSVNIKLNKKVYTSFLMYGATSQNNGFMYIVFVNTVSEKRAVSFIKIADFVANRTFSGAYSDDTSVLTINANDTIWGGIKLLMF